MRWLNEFWASVRETAFVTAQVTTLGVVAMVLGLLALNALVHHPSTSPTPAGPPRPLAALVPTLVPDTPTPVLGGSPTPQTTATPPVVASPTLVSTATPPPATATPVPLAAPAPQAPPPTDTPPPQPTATAAPAGSPTSSVPGQLMKVLPAADGLPARVRAEPTQKSPILVRVPIGASVQVLGTANGDELQPGNPRWLKVRWKNVTGYVYSTLVGEG